ncbi:MAG: SagB/ThcOx family dehydrogenase [Candidatus Omnitrophota bacterium]|jgi:SagB-type dehydrogenase family enzyme
MVNGIFKYFSVFLLVTFFIACSARAQNVKLPEPKRRGGISVEEAIMERTSVRDFRREALPLEDVSQLLWAAGGKTVDGVTGPTRAYPSAGASYPLEIYLVAGKVINLEPGVYRYNWKENSITLIRKGDLREDLAGAALGQRMISQAPVTIVIAAVFEKTTRRYGERGRTRYVSMDAGHLGQNVHLQAQSLGLGTVMVGAFSDKKVQKVLGVEGETPVYMMPVGRPR